MKPSAKRERSPMPPLAIVFFGVAGVALMGSLITLAWGLLMKCNSDDYVCQVVGVGAEMTSMFGFLIAAITGFAGYSTLRAASQRRKQIYGR